MSVLNIECFDEVETHVVLVRVAGEGVAGLLRGGLLALERKSTDNTNLMSQRTFPSTTGGTNLGLDARGKGVASALRRVTKLLGGGLYITKREGQ